MTDTIELTLFHEPKDRLRMTFGDRSYPTIKPVWASPIQRPGTYLSFLDGKGNEITMIKDPKSLSGESWRAVEVELRKRYLIATVTRIVGVREEYGSTYWHVETDRGDREFVCQNLRENALWYSDTHLMLIDTDGNRFEIPNVQQLDKKSTVTLHNTL